MAYSIVKNNKELHSAIVNRLKEIGKKQRDVIKDAANEGYHITNSMLSNYIKHGGVSHCLKEEQILWIAIRYGIDVYLGVGRPVIKENKIELVIDPYDEEKSLKKIRRIYTGNK